MKNKRLRSLILIISIVLLAGILAFSVYQALAVYIPQKREQDRFSQLRDMVRSSSQESAPDGNGSENGSKEDEDHIDLYTITVYNDEAVGWLRVRDTQIDYPVMKSPDYDPEFYLHRDFDKSYSFSGCLFFGQNCDPESDVFVIYGHNMNNGSMFGELDRYSYYDYASAHQDIIFDTLTEHRVYRVFASFQTQIYDEDDDVYKYYNSVGDFDEAGYQSIVSSIRSLSIIDIGNVPVYPSQIMLLSTCAYHTEEGRFVVAAYRVQ